MTQKNHPPLAACALALLLTARALLGATPPGSTVPLPPEDHGNEKGCLEGRVRDYLERHGDYGQIDPEVLLELSRDVHENLTRQRKGLEGDAISGLVWTSIGPTNGAGRATAIANHPVTAGNMIAGAAGGGAWKTTDSGATWAALTETIPNLSIGAIGLAASSPDNVYLGTGEGGIAFGFIPGIGLLHSSDGGQNWTLPTSVLSSQFYRVLVHPTRPLEIVVGTETGAYRSVNGQNGPWVRVINSASGPGLTGYGDVADIVRDPTNPQILYATTFDRLNWCQSRTCFDPSAFVAPTLLKSTDGGVTWASSASGLPLSSAAQRVNRMALAISPSNPAVLYLATAVMSAATGSETSRIYRTADAGLNWTETALSANASTSITTYLGTQGWYDNTIVVSPTDPNTVLAGGVTYVKSTDGGATWARPTFTGSSVHVDAHDLRYDPAGTLWIANDGGIWTSPDHGNSAVDRNANLVTRQFYALSSDPANRNRVFGGQQDNGTIRRGDAGGTRWDPFGGGDGFQSGVVEASPSIVFGTFQFGVIYRTMDGGAATLTRLSLSPPYAANEATPFFSIISQHPANPGTLFTGSYRVWKSVTGGDSWIPLPITTTDGSTWSTASTIRSLAISRSNPQVMIAAKGARLFRTTNGGLTWFRIETGLPGKGITNIEIDPADENRAFASLAGTSGTSVYFTANGGTSWTPRGTGLPPFSALVVRIDPTDPSILFCGTDVGVYRSTDSGVSWFRFGLGMPAVSVYDIQAFRDGSGLRAATYGRGMWELVVTGATNTPPTATISTPLPAVTVAKGSSLSFTGSFADTDPSDAVTAKWVFSDDWTTTAAVNGTPTTHTFTRGGKYAVTLSALDSRRGVAAASVQVTVTEAGDSCSTPLVIPSNGPFPLTYTFNTDGSTRENLTDPATGGASCFPFAVQRSIWLSFTPTATGTYDFSFCGSKSAAVLVGYTGPACGPYTSNNLCLLGLDQNTNCATGTRASAVLTAGQTVRLMLAPYFVGSFGPGSLTIAQNNAFSPAVTGVSPVSGPAAGGTAILVNGSGFAAGATVSLGGVAATNVALVSPNLLTATTSAGTAGTASVVVSSGGVSGTLADGFAYLAPAPVGPPSSRGDVNGDQTTSVADVFYLINNLFAGGPAPIGNADADSSGAVSVADVFYLINFLFAGGPAPL